MRQKIHDKVSFELSCWMTFVIRSAVGFSSPPSARPERPKEIERPDDFAGADMKGYGAEVNADISSVGRLFGTSADWNALLGATAEGRRERLAGHRHETPGQATEKPGTDHDLQAIGVARVMPDSGAQAAGLREDDLIVGIDGEPIENKGDKTLLGFRSRFPKSIVAIK